MFKTHIALGMSIFIFPSPAWRMWERFRHGRLPRTPLPGGPFAPPERARLAKPTAPSRRQRLIESDHSGVIMQTIMEQFRRESPDQWRRPERRR